MSNTYSQIYIQLVFAVKFRQSLIAETWQDLLYKYITAIVQHNNHKLIAIGGVSDHIHILTGLNSDESISHLVQEIKRDSSKWINEKHLVSGHFAWQQGYGAFSYSRSHIDNVVKYILNQKIHHSSMAFLDEYKRLLIHYGVEFDDRYLFTPPIV